MKSFDSMRTAVGLSVGLVAIAVTAAPATAGKRADTTARCVANSTASGLHVRCPNGTVAELLAALRQATGLRSEYPRELGAARVSVNTQGASLQQVVGSALAAYNFALWKDQATPKVTWLRIVGPRQAVAGAEDAGVTYQDAAAYPEVASAAAVTLMPSGNEAEMARVRESFARSIKPAPGLQPVPVNSTLAPPR